MEETVQEKQDYGVFQFRLYTVKDELIYKKKITSGKDAEETMLQYLFEDQYAPIYSRGTIRHLNSNLKDWVVNQLVPNPTAMLLNTEETEVEAWKLALYDFGDRVIESVQFTADIRETQVELMMVNKNAFYAVVSAWDIDLQYFIMTRIQINKSFNLYVCGPDGVPAKAHVPKPGEDLMLTYAKAVDEDIAETKRLIKEGYLQQDI